MFNRKGRKDRYTLLPGNLRDNMERQIAHSREIHESDLAEGFGLTSVPASLHKKYGPIMKDFGWQYLFPSSTRCVHPIAGYVCRHHLHHSTYARRLRQAVKGSGITKRVTAHTFRHAFATDLLPTFPYRKRCPPKAGVTGSNPVGRAIFSRPYVRA
ncbi:tyrosine-type recombinase/integrase [Marinobacter sp. ANT_B65]|uniref:tyrosine-type recombinase/integrase n=1 Tax=Marinobacter sp. ANT_B65 TaxID=2039467 RepID=UPI00267A35D9